MNAKNNKPSGVDGPIIKNENEVDLEKKKNMPMIIDLDQ